MIPAARAAEENNGEISLGDAPDETTSDTLREPLLCQTTSDTLREPLLCQTTSDTLREPLLC